MKTVLLIVNESPYASERAFNALRLASALLSVGEASVRLFLLSDGVYGALANQTRPEGSYDVEAMLRTLIANGALVRACGTCMDHRGMIGLPMAPDVETSTMTDLAAWALSADQTIVF